MIPRRLEPEVMDSEAEAVDYDSMDHSEVNRLFAEGFLNLLGTEPGARNARVLDVGTGTAQIPIEICRRSADLKITAVDLAGHMLQLGLRNVIRAGLTSRIKLEQIDAKSLPFPPANFEAVISNSIIHHIPEPATAFSEMVRVAKPGAVLFVRDLLRPPDEQTLQELVRRYAGDSNEHQRQMFGDSLHAALTLEETRELLLGAHLPAEWVSQTSDRHWTIAGRIAGIA